VQPQDNVFEIEIQAKKTQDLVVLVFCRQKVPGAIKLDLNLITPCLEKAAMHRHWLETALDIQPNDEPPVIQRRGISKIFGPDISPRIS
jgi:hypothetical protein